MMWYFFLDHFLSDICSWKGTLIANWWDIPVYWNKTRRWQVKSPMYMDVVDDCKTAVCPHLAKRSSRCSLIVVRLVYDYYQFAIPVSECVCMCKDWWREWTAALQPSTFSRLCTSYVLLTILCPRDLCSLDPLILIPNVILTAPLPAKLCDAHSKIT